MRCVIVLMAVFLVGCAPMGEQRTLPDAEPAAGWRHARTALYIGDTAPAQGVFRYSGLGAARITVAVSSVTARRLLVSGVCDGPGVIEAELGGVRAARGFATDTPFAFELAARAADGAVLDLGLAVTRCDIEVRGSAPYQMVLEREERLVPRLVRQTDNARGACRQTVAPPGGDALAAAFAAPGSALSMTCPFTPVEPSLLPDGREAFQARVEALTGARLSDAVLEAGDIEAEIDFTRAPELEAIYLSSLHMRADFTGHVMGRILAWHAARGAVVRIVMTDSLQRSLDRRFYEDLAARHPGIQLQMFRAGGQEGGPFDRVHRANHVKAFAALSPVPGRSVVMLGGRNLHDGFVFERPRDLSRWPFLRNYASTRRYTFTYFFAAFRDLEMVFHDDASVRHVVAHLADFWHRDHDTQAMAAVQTAGPPLPAGEGMMRHFLSVPYADGRALEDLYVALFDAAQTRIDMTSPFLNMPPRLEAAMERALTRGVAIRLVTRTEVPEPVGLFVAPLNRLFVQAHAAQIEIHAHDPAPLTLHSKLLVVDGRLAVVSSINLNQRSFWHDTENGVLIWGQTYAEDVLRQIDVLERASTRQMDPLPVASLMRGFLRLAFVRQFF
ncbi:MAG: phosphatidylserine/phosphatidylglycerophosphate/cardiolipin synthase family protein [Pararhodobacter sp.]|nr:phosphatidylserine/phosphatidylglycerophosphate/cardiolipin synthase family protein [Pararhodobacter sp.]